MKKGSIKYYRVWDVDLTDQEIHLMDVMGVTPLKIRPDHLVHFAPCLVNMTQEEIEALGKGIMDEKK